MATPDAPPPPRKTALVTGCNSGIGLEMARQLCDGGVHVIVHCRSPEKAEATADMLRRRNPGAHLETVAFDLGDLRTVDRAGRALQARHASLDVLINNAGAVFRERTLTRDGLEANFGVNYLAGFHLTNVLLPSLKQPPGARIVNVSSVTHWVGRIDFDDLQCERRYHWLKGYARAKLAVLCTTGLLARRLEGSGVSANTVDPGIVSSNIFLKDGTPSKRLLGPVMDRIMTPAWQGATTTLAVAAGPQGEGVTGAYFVKGRLRASSGASRDEETARKLWAVSESILKDLL